MAGCYEYGNEPSGSIKVPTFLNYLSDYQCLKDDLSHFYRLLLS
jgi:hypothetical protein